MNLWLNDNCIVIERFIKTLKNKIDKHMAPVSKNVYMAKLNKIVDKCNNTYHRKIKIKTADINSGTYFDHTVEHNDKDP